MKTYDPTTVILTVGSFTITGVMSGTWIKASRNEDTWKRGKGTKGDGWRTRNRDDSGALVVTIQHASPSNADLSRLALADETLGTGIVPCSLEDLAGLTLWRGKNCWIKKPADLERGDDMAASEWTIDVDSLLWFTDGNAILGPSD